MDVKNYVSMVENGLLGEFIYWAGSELLMDCEHLKWYGMTLNVNEVKKHLNGTKQGLREAVKLAAMMNDAKGVIFSEWSALYRLYNLDRVNRYEWSWNDWDGQLVSIEDVRGMYDELKEMAAEDSIVIDDSLMMAAPLNVSDWAYYRKKFIDAYRAAFVCRQEDFGCYMVQTLGWLGKMCNISEQVYGKR